jgi:serine/threonine protein kinase
MVSVVDHTGVAAQICAERNAELLRELGRGAFKQTFLIREASGLVALKIAATSPALTPRFEREAAAMQGCSHAAIARLFGSQTLIVAGQPHWICTEEYLAGGTLAELHAAGPISVQLAQQIARQMMSAIAHLFDRRLVHRDIKPENIMFRDPGQAVLTDFGIVRMLDAPTLTKAFLPAGPGTPLYAAPEQLLNDIRQIDWRADQFSLAIVLAQCLLGHPPYSPEGDAHQAIARTAQRQELPAKTVQALEAIGCSYLAKAMSAWPAQRFRTAAEFLAAT